MLMNMIEVFSNFTSKCCTMPVSLSLNSSSGTCCRGFVSKLLESLAPRKMVTTAASLATSFVTSWGSKWLHQRAL